jgi:hypothetical protein
MRYLFAALSFLLSAAMFAYMTIAIVGHVKTEGFRETFNILFLTMPDAVIAVVILLLGALFFLGGLELLSNRRDSARRL